MKSTKQDIVLSYIAQFPDLPNRTLASMIFTREEGLFADVEMARSTIRYYKGAKGEAHLKCAISAGHVTDVKHSTVKEGLAKLNIVSKAENMEPVNLGKGKYLILSDIHLPFHDEDALAAALEYGVSHEVDTIILNGDILDCYDVSRFSKEIRRPKISEELEMGRNFFKYLRELFPTQAIFYKIGNHEERMRAYVLRNARELADLNDISLESLLRLEEYRIIPVNREMINLGKLTVLHGHELGESVFSPVNPARGMFLKAKASTIVGHYHQVSHHSESNLRGEQVGVWSMGCLCNLSPDYRPYAFTKWANGFAYVTVNEDHSFHVENFKIINGQIL
jgi:predicted phosphodiesterase